MNNPIKLCSTKVPLIQREWNVGKCYAIGLKKGIAIGAAKKQPRALDKSEVEQRLAESKQRERELAALLEEMENNVGLAYDQGIEVGRARAQKRRKKVVIVEGDGARSKCSCGGRCA